jgi:hypothetical protein
MRGAPGGSPREARSQGAPATPQLGLIFGDKYRRNEDVALLRGAFKHAVEVAGGVEWLALELGRPLAYASKISEALNGVEGRHIQFEEWLPPLFSNWQAMDVLFAALCDRTNREHPKAKRVATDAERASALIKVLAKAGAAGKALLEEAAEEMGVDVQGLVR